MSGRFDTSIRLDDAALNDAVGRVILAGSDLRLPMGEIAAEWMDHVHDRFDQERDPFGVPWMKRRIDPDAPINVRNATRKVLHLEGDLERAVVPDFGSDFAQVGVLRTAGPARYARVHNEGGTITPKRAKALSFGGRLVAKVVMPKRQYIGFGPEEQRSATEVMTDYLRAIFTR